MTKVKTKDYLGVRGYGDTARDAMRDACQRLEHLANHYMPRILSYGGLHAVLYATPDGFSYTLIHEDGRGGTTIGNWSTRWQAEDAVLKHLVQSQWRPQTLAECDQVPECITRKQDRADLRDYMRTAVYWRLLQSRLGLQRELAWAVATKDHYSGADLREYLHLTPEAVEAMPPLTAGAFSDSQLTTANAVDTIS